MEQRHRECQEGTRKDVLLKIATWAKSKNTPQIFWLAGMAGTGKSTIAMTMCHTLHDEKYVVGSFFFERSGTELGMVNKLMPTLASQLATQNDAF
jgi:DNA replication protein DnaC